MKPTKKPKKKQYKKHYQIVNYVDQRDQEDFFLNQQKIHPWAMDRYFCPEAFNNE